MPPEFYLWHGLTCHVGGEWHESPRESNLSSDSLLAEVRELSATVRSRWIRRRLCGQRALQSYGLCFRFACH